MSIRSGDRARSNKVATKRRLRRSRLRLLRKVSEPSHEEKPGMPARTN